MDFIFCPEFSKETGIGHLSRCINLALELKKKGAEIIFIINKNNLTHLSNKIEKNFKIKKYKDDPIFSKKKRLELLANEIKKIKTCSKSTLVIDNYKVNFSWEKKIKKFVKKIFIIDDFQKSHFCDFYLNQGNFSKKKNLPKIMKNCITLLGPKFSLLNSKNQIRKINYDNVLNKNIIVSFGGSDRENLTFNCLKILRDNLFDKYKIQVFLGPYNNQYKIINELLRFKKNFKVYNFSPNYVDFLKKNNFSIINGGVSTLENVCHGVPSLVFQVSKNQKMQTEYLKKKKIISLIKIKKKNFFPKKEVLKKILKLIHNNYNQKKNILNGQSLVDGFGSLRVAEILFPSNDRLLKIQKTKYDDCLTYYNWFNDPINLQNSIIKKKTDVFSHLTWFNKKITDKNTNLLILKINKLAIGQIRFEKKKSYTLIDYYLDEIVRNRGWGKKILLLGLKKIRFDKNTILRAQVRKKNYPSIKIFLKLGFEIIKKNNNFRVFEIKINKIKT